jgi:L-amino acid N-acyltransferase YncA
MEIRDAHPDDWAAIWPFFHEIVSAGDTFSYDLDTSEPEARSMWMLAPPDRTSVAVVDGVVVGSANMYPNKGGGGAHVASASFMVSSAATGRGVGRALGEDMLAWARAQGFRAVQFNAVVSSNTRAVGLWKSLGFEVLTTVPEGFHHPTLGYVGLHIMYQKL